MALNVPRLRGPNDDFKADTGFIGTRGKNMNRKEMASFRFGRGQELGLVSGGFAPLLVALGGLVGVDLAVVKMHHAMRVFGNVRLVGDEHNGVAVGVQDIEE